MDEQTLFDIVEWDVFNWKRAIDFFEDQNIDYNEKRVLDIGGRNGGLSLYFALKGANVVCSDLRSSFEKAKELHKKYNVSHLITYEKIDATNIPYKNYFDIIAFKSVLGSIGSDDKGLTPSKNQQKAICEMFGALKSEGMLLFAENLTATPIHMLLRAKFRAYNWRYLNTAELTDMLCQFKDVKYKPIGVLGLLGRTERQRVRLGKLDRFVEKILPADWRYIGVFAAKKV